LYREGDPTTLRVHHRGFVMAERWSRRDFVAAATVAGAAGVLGAYPRRADADPPPEKTHLRIFQTPSICTVPPYIAKELLHAEGFSGVEYIKLAGVALPTSKALAMGQADISLNFAGPLVVSLEAGNDVVVLAGVHVGCFDLVATEHVRAVRDLKGKTVAIVGEGTTPHIFAASIAAYVGLDPRKDIQWVVHPPAEQIRLLTEGKIDALCAFPPTAQELRAKKVGHVLVNSAADRPWSQYFCCMVEANREFARKHPVATKRALRAILKATDLCADQPDVAARFLVDNGLAKNYEYALQTMKELPYNKWRELDPEDTLRFYALRLHEAGMIKSSPKKIIERGTDWRVLKELKKELKG
jgi:NitT/TauT family transport system substrate-binding protein